MPLPIYNLVSDVSSIYSHSFSQNVRHFVSIVEYKTIPHTRLYCLAAEYYSSSMNG